MVGFEKIGLVVYDYNTVLPVFYISYILFEIPSNVLCKWISLGWFIPVISLGFGLCPIFTTRVKSECIGTIGVLHQVENVKFMHGIVNPITISISFIFPLVNVTVQDLDFFAPTVVRTIYPTATDVLWTISLP